MNFKSVRCLCIFLGLLSVVGSQRTSSWGSNQGRNNNRNRGWNPNTNKLSNNYENWGSNLGSNYETKNSNDGSDWQDDYLSREPASTFDNDDSRWTSSSSSNGNQENWQSFFKNQGSQKNKWGSTSIGINPASNNFKASNSQDDETGNYQSFGTNAKKDDRGTNSYNNGNKWKENDFSSLGSENNNVYSSKGSDNGIKGTSVNIDKNSGNNKWESNKQTINNNISNNNNNAGKWEKNNQNSNGWSSSDDQNNLSNEIGGWNSINQNSGNQGSSNNKNSKSTQKQKGTPANDKSILDELDKNNWYLKGLKPPVSPAKSNLNINVAELWNTGTNSKNTPYPVGTNKRRKTRNIDFDHEAPEIKCKCIRYDYCDYGERTLYQMSPFRYYEEQTCSNFFDFCCKNRIRTRILDVNNNINEDFLLCGERSPATFSSEKIDDSIARPGEFPWMVRLENSDNEMMCGGSLIHSRAVLTTASCVSRINAVESGKITVQAGLWNSLNESLQIREVDRILIPYNYESVNTKNDIAIVIVKVPFTLTRNVNTICIPQKNDTWNPTKCYVNNWKQVEINGEMSQILNKGNTTIQPKPYCREIFNVGIMNNVDDSSGCAVDTSMKRGCLGEEGSSLICPLDGLPDRFVQIGIVSEIQCGSYGRHGIFTDVTKFSNWIHEMIEKVLDSS